MPNSTTDNQAMIGQTDPDARSRSGIHKGCRESEGCGSFKQRRCNKSFVLFLLVGYGLLQISSNLNNHDHMLVSAAKTNSTLQTNHDKDKDIITLNFTNFNAELIQYRHPFPHIKVVEYYLPYCGICRKFKQTFTHLSRDIYSWRNVIRTAQLDMAVSYNTPIAHSWSIEVVPTLRIHQTLNSSLAEYLYIESVTHFQTMKAVEYQKFMYKLYMSASLMTQKLDVSKYTSDSKVEDKVSSLKRDIMSYVQQFVRQHPHEIPATWPNLRPVTEKTLMDLMLNHPRKELFLIVESSDHTQADDPNDDHIDLGLQVIMELSSSAAWRAVRYVRLKDNKELIEDVISHKKKDLLEHADSPRTEQISDIQEQLDLLNALVQGEHNRSNNLILINVGHSSNAVPTEFSFLEVITDHDLLVKEQLSYMARATDAAGENRSKRGISSRGEAISSTTNQRSFRKRALKDDESNLNSTRKIELITRYVNQTYFPTREDKEFISTLSKFDENPTSHISRSEASKKLKESQKYIPPSLDKPRSVLNRGTSSPDESVGLFHLPRFESLWSSPIGLDHSDRDYSDYDDKLKAIRYIFFQEVPRQSIVDKSYTKKVEKLNTLINLAAVIKAYFPLPDSASVQFIDAVHNYLSSQLSLILDAPGSLDRNSTGNFDFRSLRQFIESIEAEGKRLPEIDNWRHCAKTGLPCAIWRLFHTLTAFEYKKLTQVSARTYLPPLILSRSNHQTVQQSSPLAQIAERSASEGPATSEHQTSLPLPVERVVSPPSATTSLSLTIVTPISNHGQYSGGNHNKPAEISELPTPVLLVMRDYVVNFFSCPKCAKLFREETADLSFERIRHLEPAEFSILWLWDTHNLISKRLSVSPITNPPENPKKWFPTYEQCPRCYKKPPSYLKETSLELADIFHESIEWNRDEILNFLQVEFARQPMDTILLGVPMSLALHYSIIMAVCLSFLIVLLRCASYYIERQRRHKASMLNGVQYSEELQRC